MLTSTNAQNARLRYIVVTVTKLRIGKARSRSGKHNRLSKFQSKCYRVTAATDIIPNTGGELLGGERPNHPLRLRTSYCVSGWRQVSMICR